jgi:hypothetical protein
MGSMTPLYSEYELSVRAGNALTRAGIRTIDQFKAFSENDLLKIKGLGRKTLYEIKSVMSIDVLLLPKEKKVSLFSKRELHIYRERVLNKRTLRDVASSFSLTPERIRQIIIRMKEKIARRIKRENNER